MEEKSGTLSVLAAPGPADASALERDYGFTPTIGIREGLRAFAEWYKEYYQ